MDGKTDREKDLAALDGGKRAEMLVALADLEVFYETHPGAPLPDQPVLSIRISGGTHEAKVAAVEQVAAALGVQAQWRHGVLFAQRMFGPVTLEAHYTPNMARTVIERQDAEAAKEAALTGTAAA